MNGMIHGSNVTYMCLDRSGVDLELIARVHDLNLYVSGLVYCIGGTVFTSSNVLLLLLYHHFSHSTLFSVIPSAF